jgi:hypothetical protein
MSVCLIVSNTLAPCQSGTSKGQWISDQVSVSHLPQTLRRLPESKRTPPSPEFCSGGRGTLSPEHGTQETLSVTGDRTQSMLKEVLPEAIDSVGEMGTWNEPARTT